MACYMKVCFLLAILSASDAAGCGSSCAAGQLDETSLVQVQSSIILAGQRPPAVEETKQDSIPTDLTQTGDKEEEKEEDAEEQEETKQDSIPTDLTETGDKEEEENEEDAEEQESIASLSSDLAESEAKLNAALKKADGKQPGPMGSTVNAAAGGPAAKKPSGKADDKSIYQTDLDILKDRYISKVDALAESYKKEVDAETNAIHHDIDNRNDIVRHIFDGRRAPRPQPAPMDTR